MRPCCKNVYKEYLNSDRTINTEAIAKLYPEGAIVKTKEEKTLGKKKFLFFREKPFICRVHTICYEGKEEELCNCECHIEGIKCFH